MRVRKLSRRISQLYDGALASTGLSVGQFGLLGTVIAGERLPLGTLAERLVMDRTSLSRTLKPLLAAGLVELTSREGDRRVKLVVATAEGRAAFACAGPAWRDAQSSVDALLGEQGRDALHAALDDALARL